MNVLVHITPAVSASTDEAGGGWAFSVARCIRAFFAALVRPGMNVDRQVMPRVATR